MNIRENKAITLISLVVTIIVILILSSISLGIVLGDNSVITLAKKSKENIESVQDETQSKLNTLYSQMHGGNVVDSGSGSSGNSGNPGGNTGGSGNAGGSGNTGGSSGTGDSELTGGNIRRDNYGEYVDYGLDINKNGDLTDDWKIFYTNDDGRIFLIAADYVPKTCDAITEAINQDHANMATSDNYIYYWSSKTTPQYSCNDGHNTTLNQDKPQCSFPNLFMPSGDFCRTTDHFYCSDTQTLGSCAASTLQCTENWSSFVTKSTKSDCADYAIGGPTIEMWVASWNKVHGSDTEAEGKIGQTLYVNGRKSCGYCVGSEERCSTYKYDLRETEGYNDELYFPDKTSGLCYGYWLASPLNYDNLSLVGVLSGGVIGTGFGSNTNYSEYKQAYYGLRPVVCLKEGVKLTKNTAKSTATKTVYDLSMANS